MCEISEMWGHWNRILTRNHLIDKQILNLLARLSSLTKWSSICLWSKRSQVWIPFQPFHIRLWFCINELWILVVPSALHKTVKIAPVRPVVSILLIYTAGNEVVLWCNGSNHHNFIQLTLNSGSVQVHILLAACRRFAMVRISGIALAWK